MLFVLLLSAVFSWASNVLTPSVSSEAEGQWEGRCESSELRFSSVVCELHWFLSATTLLCLLLLSLLHLKNT